MITVVLVNMNAEVKIRRYDTGDFDSACRQLVEDWKQGDIVWDYPNCNEAFSPEWLEQYGYPPEFGPDEEQGVVIYGWYCTRGYHERDDETVNAFMIRSAEEA